MFPDITGGAGGVDLSASSEAKQGDSSSGVGSVNVGGFNVPQAPGTVSGNQITIIAVAIVVAVLVMKKL